MVVGKKLVFNTALLTFSSIIMRCIALIFQVWLAGCIGSAGIGLFQLVISVGMLGSTVAISGIRFASTRLLSEEMGIGNTGGVRRSMLRCIAYSLFFGTAAALILFLIAEPVGFLWIGDARTVLSLELFSFSLPFMAMSAVFGGYFTAVGRVWKSSVVMISEELVRIGLVVLFLAVTPASDIELCCAAVIAGGLIAEFVSFAMLLLFYLFDVRVYSRAGSYSPRLTGRMLGIALPLAVSAYARTSLSTLQNLLVPRGFRAAGLSADRALAGYGVIQGMVMPIILFPSCLMLALAELLVPELTEAQVSGRSGYISAITASLLKKCLAFSVAVAAVLFFLADFLGIAIYSSTVAGDYIRIFAPLVPVMYLDMVVDGCLKGLGQMMFSMAINILEALLGVLLVYTLLPLYALDAYIGIIYFGELLNFVLSIRRLRKILYSKTRSA